MLSLKEIITEASKDVFLDKLKKLSPGSKVTFTGDTGHNLNVNKTFYFVKTINLQGIKDSGVILSPYKDLSTVKNEKYIAYIYSNGRIRKGAARGNRPNTYTLTDISDIKIS